jgi:hypothetical protein
MNMLEGLDDRKYQLLEARINDAVIENGVITSPPVNFAVDKGSGVNSSKSTRIDSIESPQNIVAMDGNSNSSSNSRNSANSRMSAKENLSKAPNSQTNNNGNAKRPLNFDNTDSCDAIQEGNSPKRTVATVIDMTGSESGRSNHEPSEPEKQTTGIFFIEILRYYFS